MMRLNRFLTTTLVLLVCTPVVSGNEGSPNCPTVCTTVNTTPLTVSIHKSQMTWLPEWYCVKAVSYNGSIDNIVHSSTLNGSTSFEVTSLEPDLVYNISVAPCNMAGCNESCDVHSVQTLSGGDIGLEVPTGCYATPDTVSIQPLIFIEVAILISVVLIILVVIALASAGPFIRRKRSRGKWTLAKNVAESAPTSSTSPLDSKPEERQLLKVCKMVLKNWKAVCIYLCIPSSKISESEQNNVGDVSQAFFDALLWWREGNCRAHHRPPTWQVLLGSIREAGFPDTAETIQKSVTLGVL